MPMRGSTQLARNREMAASMGDPRVTLTLSKTDDQECTSTTSSSYAAEDNKTKNCDLNDSSGKSTRMTEINAPGEDTLRLVRVSGPVLDGDPCADDPSEDICDGDENGDDGECSDFNHIPSSGRVRDAVNVKLLLGHQPVDRDNTEAISDLELEPSSIATSTPHARLDGNGHFPRNRMDKECSGSTLFEDREFDFLKTEPVKRSTSLKTYKTPPGTPKRKAVRFADALGLDLESVRHILNLEDPPLVPKSATKDLDLPQSDSSAVRPVKEVGAPYLAVCFQQPGAVSNFHTRVSENKVLLENCVVQDMTIEGTVRVANITFHKTVMVRYSTNSWVTSSDVPCSYVQNSHNGASDRFSFAISLPTYFSVGSKLQFALYYVADGVTHWDSNQNQNYIIECFARNTASHSSDRTWIHFL